MHHHLERRARALRALIAIGLVPVSTLAQSQPTPPPYAPAPQPYAAQPYAAQPYAAQPYVAQAYAAPQPSSYNYAQPAYAGVYSQPALPAVPPDKSPGQLQPGEHRFSLLLSVVHPLAFSIYDASGEFRLGRQAGLALVVGVGSASLKQFYKSLPDERARVWEGGMQVRFYPLGTFDHGLQVGAEIVYLTGSAQTTGTITSDADPSMSYTGPLTAKGSGFKVGPFVGYKLVLPVGLTLAAQIGVDYLSLKGLAKEANGNTKTGDAKTALLLADAGLGWSF
jgi:hypothetical protein